MDDACLPEKKEWGSPSVSKLLFKEIDCSSSAGGGEGRSIPYLITFPSGERKSQGVSMPGGGKKRILPCPRWSVPKRDQEHKRGGGKGREREERGRTLWETGQIPRKKKGRDLETLRGGETVYF